MQQRLNLSCFVILALSSTMAASAHPPETIGTHDHHAEPQQGAGVHVIDSSREWTSARAAKRWNGSYLASSDGFVAIALDKGGVVCLPEASLSAADRSYAAQRFAVIRALNGEFVPSDDRSADNSFAMRMQSTAVCTPPAGAGATMIDSFAPFRPTIRFYWDTTTFWIEGDSMPNSALMPSTMVGITSWQQQIPIPTAYFANITNPEPNPASLGYLKPNVWRLPLVATPAASPLPLTGGNFQRGAVAIAANGIPIFNPRNNTGQFSYAIGELDIYGGHCGRADDYHYHIAPVHLQSVLGLGTPNAWALDGYPIYGYTEPDGTPRLPLDAQGGHSHGIWAYHYHAIGSAATGPQSPYLMNAFHGTVVNFGGQVDPQPSALSFAPAGAPLAGATIIASSRPNADAYSMTYRIGATNYNVSYQINRTTRTIAQHWEGPSGTTNPSYVNAPRFYPYQLQSKSMAHIPDSGQLLSATLTFGEDSDYTIYPLSLTDNGNGTITDNVTGLMWQKVDSGEMTWDTAVVTAASISLGGFTDWRLPGPMESLSIFDYERNPALNSSYFQSNASGAAQYWWTNSFYANDATRVWSTNAGGGVGPHLKTQTISAGGASRFHARYVRGAASTLSHNYYNTLDGTITDIDSGLMWTQSPSASLNWNGALLWADSLTTAGHTDWRVPTVKELQSLIDITLASATTPANAKTALNRTLFPGALPTAYWSATAVKAPTPTSAWLVEFGVNTTVPAANGPTRQFQGIVSYEVMGSLYPAFAVRALVGTPCECLYDLDNSGSVDAADLTIILSEWGPSTATTRADLNLDGVVGGADLSLLLNAWGMCQ